MGLFTNRCIDRDCRHRVRKGSQFCPKCGANAPKGLAACGKCGAEVSTASRFCWECGSDLAAVAKPFIISDIWARGPEDFAVRVDDQDIQGRLTKPIIIEHGTRALFFQNGKCKGELREGRHSMGGFLRNLNNFMIDQRTSVVLVDAGDVLIDLENGDLWTSEKFEVRTVERLVMRIADPESMFVNLFKGRSRISLDEIESQLAGEIQMVLTGLVAQYTAEQLFSDINVRNQLEERLREEMAGTLGRLGLGLVQLRFVSFEGETYEKLRAERSQISETDQRTAMIAERARLNERLRETLTKDKMDAFKNEKDLEGFIRQTEHELGLKEVIRDDEMDRLKDRFSFERDREGLLRRIEIDAIKDDDRRESAWKELLAEEQQRDERHRRELERSLAVAENDAQKQEIELKMQHLDHEAQLRQKRLDHEEATRQARTEQELDEQKADAGMKRLKEIKEMEREEDDAEHRRELEKLEAFSEASAQALIAITDGPAGEQIAKLEELRANQQMTPEQILAVTAQASPEAAKALAAKYESEGKLGEEKAKLLEQQLADQRQMAESNADRVERILHTALQQMGEVAGTRARPVEPKQTVVTPGGIGGPVVINPQSGLACKHCGGALDAGSAFCPHCGKKQ